MVLKDDFGWAYYTRVRVSSRIYGTCRTQVEMTDTLKAGIKRGNRETCCFKTKKKNKTKKTFGSNMIISSQNISAECQVSLPSLLYVRCGTHVCRQSGSLPVWMSAALAIARPVIDASWRTVQQERRDFFSWLQRKFNQSGAETCLVVSRAEK